MMADRIRLKIVTPSGTALDRIVNYVNLPTSDGSLGILADHAPMLCAMPEGETFCRMEDGTEKTVRHSSGVANVRDNRVTILADRAEL